MFDFGNEPVSGNSHSDNESGSGHAASVLLDRSHYQLDLRVDDGHIWQTIAQFDLAETVMELVQNELDAGSTHTEIWFEEDGFVCQGNGAMIDEDGWKRLQYLFGAGCEVPAKVGGFGIKNHGTRTLFALANDIRVTSGGCEALLTLCGGKRGLPAPRAGLRKSPGTDGPTTGCRVSVAYRQQSLRVGGGEPLEFTPPTERDIEALFENSLKTLPARIMGTLFLGGRERYKLVLHHWELGTASLEWSAARAVNRAGLELVARKCVAKRGDAILQVLQEKAYRFNLPRGLCSRSQVPEVFHGRLGQV